MQYSHLGEESDGSNTPNGSGTSSQHNNNNTYSDVESSSSRPFSTVSLSSRRKSENPELQEPLTTSNNNNNAAGDDDPFYVFREDLYRKLDLVDDGLSEYLSLVHQTDTAVNALSVKDAKKQLKRHVRNAESTLKDVQMTISLVETAQPAKFEHISPTELYERKALVTTSNDRLQHAKADMVAQSVKDKLLQDEQRRIQRLRQERRMANANNSNAANGDDDDDVENAAFIENSQAQTSLLMQQQDDTLDELGDAVVRVGQMAENIHDEIGLQNKMLTEMEDDLADAEEKLGLVMGKLAKFLKTKDKWQLGTIVVLMLIVLVLFFFVVT